MHFPSKAVASILVAAMAIAAAPVQAQQAQNSIFPSGWDNNVRSRLFMRIGYTTGLTKTKSEEARDITGQVLSRQEIEAAFNKGVEISQACAGSRSTPDCARYADWQGNFVWETGLSVIQGAFDESGETGIGTPRGIKAKVQRQIGTPTLSVGFWLDPERRWLLEGFVLAQPMSIKVDGDGVRADGTPNGVNGRHIATVKLLPPLVIGSYHFGAKENTVRPYLGVGAMYAVFFDGKTTDYFDFYQGGKSTISTKNTFGFGPFVGLQTAIDDDWHVNISVGRVGLRARSTIVTSNTLIQSGSPVLKDINPLLANAIKIGDAVNEIDSDGLTPLSPQLGFGQNGLTTLVSELAARNRGQANLGTYVREQKMKITNTIITLSVGRSF